MNLLGVGVPELVVIFVIMLVFAGPKRMVRWAYVLGQYTAHRTAQRPEPSGSLRYSGRGQQDHQRDTRADDAD